MADPKIRFDVLANAEGEQDVLRLADALDKVGEAVDPALGESASKIAQQLRELGRQQEAIETFTALKRETEAARTALDEAQAAAQKAGRELSNTEKPTRAQVGQFEKLKDAVSVAKKELVDKTQALGAARTALGAAGISTENLAATEIKLRDSLKATRAEAAQFGDQLKTLGTSAGSAVKTLSDMKVELAAAGAAVIGIQRVLGSAAQASAQFSTAIAEVSTLLDDTSNLDQLSESVRALTRQYGGDAAEQAKALYQIISAGASDAAEATEILTTANRLAVGGVTDIKTAADGLTSILNAYGDAAGTSTQVSDALFVAMKAGKTTVGELSSSIGQVAPIAAQSGVALEELLAATAALTKGGTSTSQSMTQVRAILTAVVKPTADAAKVAQELGLQFDAQSLKAKGLAGFLEEVRQKTGGNTETMAKLFGSVEALGGAIALTGSQAASFDDILGNMAERAGATDTAFAKLADSPAQSAARFSAALRDVQLALGEAVTSFEPLLKVTTNALNAFNELPGPIKTTTVGIGAAAVALPALGAALKSITTAVNLARVALLGQAAAATATVVPTAAAAAGTAALGTASAAATPAITGAAAATTGLARAVTLLKTVTGIGLVATLGQMAYELIRGKKAAEEADDAVTDLLRDRGTPATVPALETTTKAVVEVKEAAQQTVQALKSQEDAARRAAEALGVDLVRSSSKVSSSLELQLTRLADLEGGLEALAKQGIDTGNVVRTALEKMIEGARNQAEIDALRSKIEALGKAGAITKDQLSNLMETLQKKAAETVQSVDKVAEAYRTFGLKTKAELQAVADRNREAWIQIRNDATASLATKQQAFRQYAESSIAANGGVASSNLKVEAAIQKVEIQVDKAGKATVKSMGEASEAVEKTTKRFNELNREVNRYGEEINQVAGSLGGKVDALRSVNAGTAGNLLAPGIKSDFGKDAYGPDGTRVGGSFQVDVPAGYYYTLDPSAPGVERPAGYTRDGVPIPGYFARLPSSGGGGGSNVGPFGGFAGSPAQRAGQPNPNVVTKTVQLDLKVNGGAPIPVTTTEGNADRLLRELELAQGSGA